MQEKIKSLSLRKTSPYIDAFRITRGVKFSKAKRNLSETRVRDSSPSPNQYKPENYEKSRISPKYSFGREKKFFLSKKEIKCKTQIPGPGKYQPAQSRTSIKITIPQGQRLGLEINRDTPAVGSYEIQKASSKHNLGVKFGKQKRPSLPKQSSGPAPNQYCIDNQKLISVRQTFGKSKKLSLKLDALPGVGQYSIFNFKEKHSPSARITSSRRNERRYHTIDEPGPANYSSCSVEKYKPHSKLTTVIFSKAHKQQLSQELLPGPGHYNLTSNSNKITGAFLTGRYFKEEKDLKPGPANYHPKLDLVAENSRSARIGKAPRLSSSKQLSPSPHDYEPQKAAKINFASTGFTFPKRKRIFQ